MANLNPETSNLLETEIQSSQIQLLLKSSVQSAFGNIFVALVFTLFYRHFIDDAQNTALYIWLAAIVLTSLLRWRNSRYLLSTLNPSNGSANSRIQSFSHLNDTEQAVHLNLIQSARKHYAWILMTAALWGTASLAFFSEHPIAQTVLMVSIAGIAAGGLSSLSPVKPLLFAFLALILVPLEVQLLLSHGEQSLAFAMMLLLFVLFIAKSGVQQHQLIIDMISSRFENQQLIGQLTQAKEQAEEAITVKSHFLTNISHELRTPLNAILGFTSLLKQKESDPKKRYYQDVIEESGHHLLSIINDILDLSRIENHQIESQRQACEINALIQTVLDQHTKQSEQKAIEIIVHHNTDIPPSLEMDARHWQQILNNLLSNALKFSHHHKQVRIELDYQPQTHMLTTHVIDQGIGISSEQQKNIFEAFSQADSSSTRQYGGLGLGLTICRHLTRLLGGQFSLESEFGQGSRFTFSAEAVALSPTPVPEKKPALSKDSLSGHVLIVEDNLTNQILMKSLIGKLGLTFDIANDGIEAIECFDQKHYDLILMDENMPRLNGTEATQQIRRLEAEQALVRTPIIAVTANASEDDRQKFLAADMDDFIPKPVNISLLIAALKKALK